MSAGPSKYSCAREHVFDHNAGDVVRGRPGGHVGYVGVSHDVELPGLELFNSHVHLHGGAAPVRDYLPELTDLILRGEINAGKVFDVELSLDEAAEGYKAMDERRAIKVLLRP
jgi:threonine dehydrogenase-like Zn-dependent dehydrogenase